MFASGAVFADTAGWDHMGGWEGGWMWFWGFGMMTLFVLLIVWLVRGVASPVSPGAIPPPPDNRAEAILGERYANGELTTEEYRERVRELQ